MVKQKPYIRGRPNLAELERVRGLVAQWKIDGRPTETLEKAVLVLEWLDAKQKADQEEDMIRAGLGVQRSLL